MVVVRAEVEVVVEAEGAVSDEVPAEDLAAWDRPPLDATA